MPKPRSPPAGKPFGFGKLIRAQAAGDFESALYNLGVIHFQNAEIPDAITYLGRAANANPKDANALRTPQIRSTAAGS